MLGRTLVPLTFNDGEKEIVVKDLGALKEVFKREFYTQLVAYLHNKRLERFFFALGMDEVKETIENLKNSGKSDLEVINKVAELISVEPISVELSENVNFAKRSNLLEELSDKDQELSLVLSSYFLRAPESELRGSKVFKGEVVGYTELVIKGPKLKGSSRLIFENLNVVMDGEVIFEGFENVEFKNVRLKAEKPVKFVNTSVELYSCDVVGCLWVEDARLNAERSEFHDSNLSAIYSVRSSLVSRSCKFIKNKGAAEHMAQVRLSNSRAEFSGCEIAEGENSGLLSEGSRVYMVSCKIYENKIEGMSVKGGSNLDMEACDIYKNSALDRSQVYIEDSDAVVNNSHIHDSSRGNGIVISKSEVSIRECKIYRNDQNGIIAKNKTALSIEGSDLSGNTSSSKVLLSVMDGSTAIIRNSIIHKGWIGMFALTSKVSIDKSLIYDNQKSGLYIIWESELEMKDCKVFLNGEPSDEDEGQIHIEGSKASIYNSEIIHFNSKVAAIYLDVGHLYLDKVTAHGIRRKKGSIDIHDSIVR